MPDNNRVIVLIDHIIIIKTAETLFIIEWMEAI